MTGNRVETTRDWGESDDGYTTTYQYDVNDRLTTETKVYAATSSLPDEQTDYGYNQTQQTSKTVSVATVVSTVQTFDYNLQGRMSSVTKEVFDSQGIRTDHTQTRYEYDSSGNRVATEVHTDDDNDGQFEESEIVTRTEYLTDSQNHTGYSQVLQETEYVDGEPSKKTVYTIGHDQISQTVYEAVERMAILKLSSGTNWKHTISVPTATVTFAYCSMPLQPFSPTRRTTSQGKSITLMLTATC